MRIAAKVRSSGPTLHSEPDFGPLQRGCYNRETASGTTWRTTTHTFDRIYRLHIQGFRGRRQAQVRAKLALLDRCFSLQFIAHYALIEIKRINRISKFTISSCY